MEVFNIAPANVNARKNYVRSLLLHKSIQKVDFRAVFRYILSLFCFDFLHRRTKMISMISSPQGYL